MRTLSVVDIVLAKAMSSLSLWLWQRLFDCTAILFERGELPNSTAMTLANPILAMKNVSVGFGWLEKRSVVVIPRRD